MLNSSEKKLTVFTPTYNRGYILSQLYDSLKKQTNKKFLWLIVDDGSTDNTEELVAKWINEQLVDIVYIKQINGGKMKAHNTGVNNTHTELFVCVDSDDWMVPTSVETILTEWNELSLDTKKRIAGFIAYKGKTINEVIGNEFPIGMTESSLSELYNRGFYGDTTIVFKTDIIKQYPFPIIAEERFITEAYIYDQIDQIFTYYLIPSIMIVCEYRNDGLTQNLLKISFNNPCGYTAYFMQKANLSKTLKEKTLNYIRANCFRHKTRNKNIPVIPHNRVLYNLTYPIGILLFLNKKRKYMKAIRGSKWEK